MRIIGVEERQWDNFFDSSFSPLLFLTSMIFGTVRIEREYLNARERNWNGWRKNGDTKKPINESLSLSLRFYHWFYQFLPTRSSHICSFDILESIKREGGCGYTRVKKRRNNEFDTMGWGAAAYFFPLNLYLSNGAECGTKRRRCSTIPTTGRGERK